VVVAVAIAAADVIALLQHIHPIAVVAYFIFHIILQGTCPSARVKPCH
jgi:hypothetical protein